MNNTLWNSIPSSMVLKNSLFLVYGFRGMRFSMISGFSKYFFLFFLVYGFRGMRFSMISGFSK